MRQGAASHGDRRRSDGTACTPWPGMTLHRLLGFNPGNRTRFRHNRLNRLPHDVVVVDETSMVSLSLMARLLEAVRPDARLILVGDPEQLASVEAGAVLGDIVGPGLARALHAAAGAPGAGRRSRGRRFPPATATDGVPPIGDGIVVLRHVHRYGGAIAELAQAIRRGDADEAVAILAGAATRTCSGSPPMRPSRRRPRRCGDVRRPGGRQRVAPSSRRPGRASARDGHRRAGPLPSPVRSPPRARGRGDVDGPRRELAAGRGRGVRHRHGLVRRPSAHRDARTTTGWSSTTATPGWWSSRTSGRLVAAFERGGTIAEVSPTRLAAVDTVYAMTVHKSQGSQFETVAFLLPSPDSRILTRELLYTAVTRAQERLDRRRPRGARSGPPSSGRSPGPRGSGRPSGARRADRARPARPASRYHPPRRIPAV